MSASVEIYIGGAGVGKSTRLYTELVDLAYRNPGKKYYLIVPEQAGSSMEQRILSLNKERTGRNGFFNIDIIGFRMNSRYGQQFLPIDSVTMPDGAECLHTAVFVVPSAPLPRSV